MTTIHGMVTVRTRDRLVIFQAADRLYVLTPAGAKATPVAEVQGQLVAGLGRVLEVRKERVVS